MYSNISMYYKGKLASMIILQRIIQIFRKPLHAECSSKNNLDYISSIKLDKHAHENKYFVCANSFFNEWVEYALSFILALIRTLYNVKRLYNDKVIN